MFGYYHWFIKKTTSTKSLKRGLKKNFFNIFSNDLHFLVFHNTQSAGLRTNTARVKMAGRRSSAENVSEP